MDTQVVAAYRGGMIEPRQIRAARALLGWKQTDLAAAAKISIVALKNLELGLTDPRSSTINAIQAAFAKAGVIFLEDGDVRDGGSGVRLKSHKREGK